MIAKCPLNIIVVGGGGLIGPRHATHVSKNEQTLLFGIIDPSPAGVKVATDHGARYFPSIKAMIEYCDEKILAYPDGAIICTPNHTHIKLAAELASYGINLLVEKPLSSRAEESTALKDYVRQSNVKLLVGHHRRFNPYIIETKKNLGRVGNIIAVQGTWTLRKDLQYFKNSSWRTHNSTGGGALLINIVHDLDLLQYLFGSVERVYAEPLHKQREYDNVDEGAVLTLKFKNGICGTFICSDNVTSPYNFEAGTGENPTIPFAEGLQGFYRVFGSKGTLSVPDLSLYHQDNATNDTENSWFHPINKESLVKSRKETLQSVLPFDLQLDHFVDVIRGLENPFCSADDGISALLCVDAVIESIKTESPQLVKSIEEIVPDYNSLGLAGSGIELSNNYK